MRRNDSDERRYLHDELAVEPANQEVTRRD